LTPVRYATDNVPGFRVSQNGHLNPLGVGKAYEKGTFPREEGEKVLGVLRNVDGARASVLITWFLVILRHAVGITIVYYLNIMLMQRRSLSVCFCLLHKPCL